MTQALGILIGGLLQGGAFSLVAIGLALVYRVTGAVNLSQGAFVILGALSMYWLQATMHWPLAVAIVGALAISLGVGAIIARLIFLPGMRRLPMSGMVLLTAGTSTLLGGAMLLAWGGQPYQLLPWSGITPVEIFGTLVPTQAFWEFAVTGVLVVTLWYVLNRTSLGKALSACAENPAAARLMGIKVPQMTLVTYMIATALGAAGGIVCGPVISAQFDGGDAFTIFGFIAVAIGGMASFFGALFGGISLGVIEQFAAGYVSSLFSTSLALALLLIVLVFRPNGLFAARSTRREDVRDAVPHALDARPRFSPAMSRLLGAVGIAVIVLAPFIGGSSVTNSLVIAGVLYISVLGLDIITGYAGQVSLGHAAFMAIGAYGAAIATVRYHLAPLSGIVIGLVATLVCAAFVAIVSVRLRGHYLTLATLAFGLLVDSILVGNSDFTGGPSGLAGIPHLAIAGHSFESPIENYYIVWGTALVALFLLTNAMRSKFGRGLRAIRVDPVVAASLGIPVARYKFVAFLISATCASIAGSLYAFYFQFLSPEMVGTPQSIALITALIIGGEGTLVGPIIGIVLITMLPIAIQSLATYKTLFSGSLLVLALLYLPRGLYGWLVALLRRPASPKTPSGSIHKASANA